MQHFDLQAMTESELDRLIADATRERATRDAPSEDTTDSEGNRGQDVEDPGHGAITTPTPHEVRDRESGGLQPGARVEGTTVRDADEVESDRRIEEAARRVV